MKERKLNGMSRKSCQHPIKTQTNGLAGHTATDFEMIKKHRTLSLSLMWGLLIALFTVIGCSDMPYTGSMLTADDVDRYLVLVGEDTYCLENGPDSACLTLTPRKQEINAPIIHIYPEKLVYIFYRDDGTPLLEAEKMMDTTEIVEELTETMEDPPPQTTEQPDDDPVVDDADDDIFSGDDGGTNNGGNNDGGTPPPPPPPPPPPADPQPPPPAATTLELVSGNEQSDEISQPLDDPLVVRVLDQDGVALSGVTVIFSVSPSGSLNPPSATTGANGQASTTLTLGETEGEYTVTASASGTTQPVTFTATATDPSPPPANTQPQPPANTQPPPAQPPAQPPPAQPPAQPPPTNTQPPASTGDEWLIKVYYDVPPMTHEAAVEYSRGKVTLANTGFTIKINGTPITDDDITSRAGIVEADRDGDELHRPGFQFIYRTTATSLNIMVVEPISGQVEQLKL